MNSIILIGRLAADPEIRSTASGVACANFRLAVQRRFKDANGERATDWISCVAWRQNADFLKNYIRKGDQIAVQGSLQTRSYTAQDGSNRNVCEVVVDNVQSLGSSQNKSQNAEDVAQAVRDTFGADFVEVDDGDLPF